MKDLKSHFQFTKQQRNGIFLLLILIAILQCAYFYISNISNLDKEYIVANDKDLQVFQAEIDALRRAKIETNKPKTYPYNPNFITDSKGYKLGMTTNEIDRLLMFRAQNKWVNSAKEFQQVTKISDSVLAVMSPNFKFPKWVNQPKQNRYSAYVKKDTTPKTYSQKLDLNTATALQLKKVKGVGETLSKRILKYRKQHHNFVSDVELEEIYGLSREVIIQITNQFTVKTPKQVEKIILNTANRDDLVTIKYIDYNIAYQIIEERTLREGFKSLEELTKVKDFPVNKFAIIRLYLQLN